MPKPAASQNGMNETGAKQRPALIERCFAVCFYFGTGPFFLRRRRHWESAFLRHHYDQAMVIMAMLFAVAAFFVTVVLIDSWVMVHHRGFFESFRFEPRVLDIAWKLFLCWLVFEGFAISLALLGSANGMLLVDRLMKLRAAVAAGALLPGTVYAIILAMIPLTMHASSLIRQDEKPGQAYFLYEDLGKYPRWLFAIGFYRMSLAARRHYGPGETVALRLTEESIARAKKEGRFIFIGSHGLAKGMLLETGYLKPDEVRAMPGNSGLEYVYMTSCDSGAQREAWEEAFAPAEVVTHERLTALIEHIWWMWFTGPEKIRELKAVSNS